MSIPTLYAEKYSDDQIIQLYEKPPFGEPKSLDNHLIVGPLGVGKTILLKNLSLRIAKPQYLSIYVDLADSCIPELGEELPKEVPSLLFPDQMEFFETSMSCLGRSIIAATLISLSKEKVDPLPMVEKTAGILGTDPKNINLTVIARETNDVRVALYEGKIPSAKCLGGKVPAFISLCEAIAAFVSTDYGRRVIFLLDQLDQVPPVLQERVVDVLRRELKAVYFIATRPCPAAPDRISNLVGARHGDFEVFKATYGLIPIDDKATFLCNVSKKLENTFGISFPPLDLGTLRTIAWLSGGSIRMAIEFLLEVRMLSKSLNKPPDESLVRQAVQNVCTIEAKSLQGEGRRQIPQVIALLNRWVKKFEDDCLKKQTKFKSFRIDFGSAEFPPRIDGLFRTLIRGNTFQYPPNQVWYPDETPQSIIINPVLFVGRGKFDIMNMEGEEGRIAEKIEDITGYFSGYASAREIKRRIPLGTAAVFVAVTLLGSSIRDARQTEIVSILETASKGQYHIISGTGISGKILPEIEDRIKKSHAMVADLSSPRPDVLAEVGVAIGKNIPIVFAAGSQDDRNRLPRVIMDYGVFTYKDNPSDLINEIRNKLNYMPKPHERWERSLEGGELRSLTRVKNILCIAPTLHSSANRLNGVIQTVANTNGFNFRFFEPSPDTAVALDELVRQVSQSFLILIDLAGIDEYEFAVYALVASGLAYAWRSRYLGKNIRATSKPIIYSTSPEGYVLVPHMLQELVLKGTTMSQSVIEKVKAHCNKFRTLQKT